jgi:hypothetical protein
MIVTLLQFVVILGIAFYLYRWRAGVRRRSAQTWDSLLARLSPEWSARVLSDQFLWKEGLDAAPEEIWQRMEGPKGLWIIFKNAGVMLELADYAVRHTDSVDPVMIASLRSDAMQIRVCVLMAMSQYAFSQASAGVRINAYRAASLYTSMAASMTELLQNNAAGILPDFVAAM